jgi:hypothetical protein
MTQSPELAVAHLVLDAIEPETAEQRIDLAPLWASLEPPKKRPDVFSVLGHLRSLDPEREHTFEKDEREPMVVIVTRTVS